MYPIKNFPFCKVAELNLHILPFRFYGCGDRAQNNNLPFEMRDERDSGREKQIAITQRSGEM